MFLDPHLSLKFHNGRHLGSFRSRLHLIGAAHYRLPRKDVGTATAFKAIVVDDESVALSAATSFCVGLKGPKNDILDQ